ncbi:DNA-methyltransferase [Enterobacter huaxiensis]|uniref:DNA-methyltransferase n=1 Tax=Enterobacter huaxiensis TaxID=2494702 RepID=UPI00217581E7|nr:site-specific DNA-methyltransferase [Enterobacter huaxiensis]MCS5452535.1 site-specific DNA-methyltransferase [Enterobacter huaxiensis]
MRFDLYNADCLEILSGMPENSIDSIVTDPPYGINFLGSKWDYDTPSQEIWEACLRVLKPGGYLLSFASGRTYHRIACRIEDAGFDIRDQLLFLYGTGFPKSMDIQKALEKAGVDPEGAEVWAGWGTGLKPAHEPIVMARKPFKGTLTANLMEHGTGALNIEASRVGDGVFGWGGHKGFTSWKGGLDNEQAARPTCGRWPANLAHDGSEDIAAHIPVKFFYCAKPSKAERNEGITSETRTPGECTNRKEGTAGLNNPRAGAGRTSGNANYHPTVKPVALMQWLIKLVTPKDGVTLDLFMGSGTTGKAAMATGFRFIGIEKDAGYFELAYQRIQFEAEKFEAEKDETLTSEFTEVRSQNS